MRRTTVADLQRIVPDAIVDDGIMVILLSTDADGFPDPTAYLGPRNLHAGICLPDPAVVGMYERLGRALLLETKHARSPFLSRL